MKNLVDILDTTAEFVESKGLVKEARNIDAVSNSLERFAIEGVDQVVKQYKDTKAMGLCTAIDLKDCKLEIMQDKEAVTRYSSTLVKLLDMEPVGELQIAKFGNDGLYGFSFSQFIMTSLLSGHFIEKTRSIYIDVFSCKEYDPKKIVEFSELYFEGKAANVRVTIRP